MSNRCRHTKHVRFGVATPKCRAIASPEYKGRPACTMSSNRGNRRRAPAVEDLVNTAIPAPLRNDALASRRRRPSRHKPRDASSSHIFLDYRQDPALGEQDGAGKSSNRLFAPAVRMK
jgi:hypothetical protein